MVFFYYIVKAASISPSLTTIGFQTGCDGKITLKSDLRWALPSLFQQMNMKTAYCVKLCTKLEYPKEEKAEYISLLEEGVHMLLICCCK